MRRHRDFALPNDQMASHLLAQTTPSISDLRKIVPTRFDEIPDNYKTLNIQALKLLGLVTPYTDYARLDIPQEIKKMRNPKPLDLENSWCLNLPHLKQQLMGEPQLPTAIEIINAYPMSGAPDVEIQSAVHKLCAQNGINVERVWSSTRPEYKLKRVFVKLSTGSGSPLELVDAAKLLGTKSISGRQLYTTLFYD